jgi:pimeloyl-ACP methyl ester carboxylesterase
MLSKSLLSLAVAASLVGMSGCNISSVEDNDTVIPESQAIKNANGDNVTHVFDAFNQVFALGTDLIFGEAATTDGTANVGEDGGNPVLNALNDLDGGISTLAPIDLNLTGSINPDSIDATNVILVRLPNQADAAALTLPLIEFDENNKFVGAYKASIALDEGHTQRQMTALDLDALSLATIGALFSTLQPDGTASASPTLSDTPFGLNLLAVKGSQPIFGTDYSVKVITQDGVANNTVRIIPLKPLDAKTKYITVLTSGVKGVDGKAMGEAATYKQVSGTADLFTPNFVPLRTYYQTLESLATNIITVAGQASASLSGAIVSTTARTTGDPTMVLKSMAYPGYWAKNAVAGGSDAAAKGLSDQLTAAAYENPRARPFELIKGINFSETYTGAARIPFYALSPTANTAALGGQKVWISQGAIQLPQYLKSLATDGSSTWEANTAISAALGIATPTDKDGETNVTYRYPFAEVQRTIVAPLLFIEPISATDATTYAALGAADSACGDKPLAGWPVIIFQHGITTNRATSLLAGTSLAVNTCSVVVAMDLTHHGVAPQSNDADGTPEDNALVAFTVDANEHTATYAPWATAANAQSATDGSILGDLAERHESLYTVAGVTTPMSYEAGSLAGDSGDLYIRLDNFQRNRDNNGQSVMDLLNLNATLSTINIDGIAGADLDINSVSLVGHSLGAMVGTVFTAVNNDATVQAGNTNLPFIDELIVATPGGGTTKFLESSVSFGSSIKAGLLAAASIAPGNSSFESFMQVLQATVDPVDPLNFISSLAAGGTSATPTLVFEMVGGAAIVDGSADHSGTAGMPTVFYTDATATTGVYPSDLTIPNNNYAGPFAATSAYFAAFTPDETAQVALTGTDAYVKLLGADKVIAATNNLHTGTHLVSKLTSGVHGTFSSANGTASFTEMMTQAARFIGNNGADVFVGNDAVLDSVAE